jgi:4-carboxymuconolactone decarboxylase
MARVSLVEEHDRPDLAGLIGKIKGSRGRLLNVYKLLLHSPDVAAAWLELIGAVRWRTSLADATREIAIIRVAMLNGVDYVVQDHVPSQALKAGLTPAQCEALGDWEPSALFDPAQRAVLAYADAMTLAVDVPDALFGELRRHFGERQVVELTVLVAAYNMQTRVLRALRIDPEE